MPLPTFEFLSIYYESQRLSITFSLFVSILKSRTKLYTVTRVISPQGDFFDKE